MLSNTKLDIVLFFLDIVIIKELGFFFCIIVFQLGRVIAYVTLSLCGALS